MGIGSGIALFVIGAILAFALNFDTGGVVDLRLIGYILMGAGAIVFLLSLVLTLRRRQSVSESRTVNEAGGAQVTTRRTSEDGAGDL